MEKQNFWSECLSLIKQQITNQAYETWFSDVEILELYRGGNKAPSAKSIPF